MAQSPSWKDKAANAKQQVGQSKAGKKGFDWLWEKSRPVGTWMNKQTGKLGIESWAPETMDKEIEKAARILWSFSNPELRGKLFDSTDPMAAKKAQRVLKSIPPQVIAEAEGLAIITLFRMGLVWSGAGGSGLIIARDSPTSWGAPSGCLIHTIGFGFAAGVDIFDAVLVLRTRKAVEAFTTPRVQLGADIAVAAGPYGSGLDAGLDLRKAAPILSYVKSKGIYGGVQISGQSACVFNAHLTHAVILERQDENAVFYGRKVSAKQILEGGYVAVPESAEVLHKVIAAAEGQKIDMSELPEDIGLAPSDLTEGRDVEDLNADEKSALDRDESFDPAGESQTTPARSVPPPPTSSGPSRSVPPLPSNVAMIPRSPREVDPDDPSEQLVRPPPSYTTTATNDAPPPRPPRRAVPPTTSASASPRQSSELQR